MRTFSSVLLLVTLAVPAAQAQHMRHMRPASPNELIAVENDWSQAAVKRDGDALKRFYADDYIFTNEDGVTSDKTKEIANITTGMFQLTSFEFSDLNVRFYGDVAVVTGQNTIKGRWEDIDKDISGPYRFTDVFIRRNEHWQAVASQSSRITPAGTN